VREKRALLLCKVYKRRFNNYLAFTICSQLSDEAKAPRAWRGAERRITMLDSDFYKENENALPIQHLVVRDSLGTLAVQILSARNDLSKDLTSADFSDLVVELYDIISELHSAYTDVQEHRGLV
jgi:CHAD domain-containing protein